MSLFVAIALLLAAAGVMFRDAKAPSYLLPVETIAGTEPSVESNSATQKESCKPVQKQRKLRPRIFVAARSTTEWQLVTSQTG
jgi:hypothetical protein